MSRMDGIVTDIRESIEDFGHEIKLMQENQNGMEQRLKVLEETLRKLENKGA